MCDASRGTEEKGAQAKHRKTFREKKNASAHHNGDTAYLYRDLY